MADDQQPAATQQSRRRFLKTGRDVAMGLGAASLLVGPTACDSDSTSPAAPRSGPPNIILFLVDDMGAIDCGSCGSHYYRTPGMDRMAQEGIRFTQAYSPSPLCSSSRSSILTGKYPHRLGITGAIHCPAGSCRQVDVPALAAAAPTWQKVVTPSYLTQLPLDERTCAEYLRDAGYVTAFLGKWHLGGGIYSAASQGFTHVIGGDEEAAPKSHIAPYGITGLTDGPRGEYLADRLTAETKTLIGRNQDKPFFITLSHYGVHVPLQAPADLKAQYDALLNVRDAQRNATYAAMVASVDRSLNQLLEHLDNLGIGDNTLVIMTSDNGGLMQTAPDTFLRRITSNGPFRGGKAHIYEGGIRVPLLARWPAHIAAGHVCYEPVIGTDLLPTALDVAGITAATPLDGRSLRQEMTGSTDSTARALFWHFPHYTPMRQVLAVAIDQHALASLPASAVRLGDYKLIRIYGEGTTNADFIDELYDLSADPGEKYNIVSLYPEKRLELANLLVAHLAETGALTPFANPNYRERLDGWRPGRHCTVEMAHGYLRVTTTGDDPQIISDALLVQESFICRVRVRSNKATAIILFHSVKDTPVFNRDQRTAINVAAGTAFREIEFRVEPVDDLPIKWLRLDTGKADEIIDIESITLLAAADTSRVLYRWGFDGVTGLSYGGSWFSENDAFVACGPGSLQIDMAGTEPAIISPPVTLFGPLNVQIRMRSTGAGNCALLWSTQLDFSVQAGKRVDFAVPHDGEWHEHQLLVNDTHFEPMQKLLLLLGNTTGVAEIDYIRVSDMRDSLVAQWEFCAGETAG